MSRTLLIVSAGIEAIPGIRRAKEMGLTVVVSDASPNAPGIAVADHFLHASTYDAAETSAAAQHFHQTVRPLDGVMCMAADVPHTVAAVATALGLLGPSPETARLATDKLAMKRRFAEAGVAIPWFAPVADARHLAELIAERDQPLILKPADSRGGRGVLRLCEGVEPAWAYDYSRSHSPSGRVMVEEYLVGPQVSTEGIVLEGVAHTPGFSDRNYELLERYAPHVIENGGELPSHLDDAQQALIRHEVARAAAALGIRDGVFKGDMVLHRGEAKVIEIAARLSGGYFCSHEIPLNTGVDFVGCAIRMALGEHVAPDELTPRFQRPVVQRYLFPTPGRIIAIRGEEEARRMPGIEELLITARIGDKIRSPVDSNGSAGMVLATGPDRAEALRRAEAAVAAVTIETAAA